MVKGNLSEVTEFILLGFTDNNQLQFLLFVMILGIYTVSLVANLGIITIIRTEPRLHTPMYFFLRNLSFVDLTYSAVIAPKTLVNLLAATKAISFTGCVTQFFFHSVCINTEVLILAVMAYDRFIAICKPLLYTLIMSRKACFWLVIGSYSCACAYAIAHTSSLFSMPFCGPNVINHFFCDIPPLQKLSCSHTHFHAMVHFVFASVAILSTVLIISVSYLCIIFAILRIRSAKGRHKAFSTCASHLTTVSMLYGTLLFMYVRPTSSKSADQDKLLAVFYTLVIPMVNPLIYSLRNKEVKDALKKILHQKTMSQ
ncbi:olfactory receptor 5AP2-like [Alligator mississippiensis]|uniref:olfactory receptor 5AP2-like n=1 Tax=Alligator mississippiensis TaxID=8496 RepID=UPI0003D0E1A6|nr:olfactory receptor 5AP2-like [Alligator mississippiensis]